MRAAQARKNERMRKLANERIRELDNEKINRLVDRYEKKRKGSEHLEGYRRVVLAYRKLIGSLYESWKMGIEMVYKYLDISFLRELKQ